MNSERKITPPKMHWLVKLAYYFFKTIVGVSMNLYFKERIITSKEKIIEKEGHILVSNHPNTLFDPLNVAHTSPKIVHFLANAGLFKGKIANWFFSTFYCIKIERPEDVKGRTIRNDDAFQRSYDFLANGGALYIAPEGSSWVEKNISKVKTGTARIALNTLNSHPNKMEDLKIIPIGLNYNKIGSFRENLIINIGEPISTAEYYDGFKQNSVQSIRSLTQQIESQLQQLTIHLPNSPLDNLFHWCEIILTNEKKLKALATFQRNKKLETALATLQNAHPKEWEQLNLTANKYFTLLSKHNLTDEVINFNLNFLFFIKKLCSTIFWALLFIFCNILVGPLVYILLLITKKAKLYEGYNSTAHVLLSLFLLPLWMAIISSIFSILQISTIYTIIGISLIFPAMIWLKLSLKKLSLNGRYFFYRHLCHKNTDFCTNILTHRSTLSIKINELLSH